MTTVKSLLNHLVLVHPPFSAQEAVWATKDDPDFHAELRTSNLYAIAGRAEAKFTDFQLDKNSHALSFNFKIANGESNPVTLNLRQLPGMEDTFLRRMKYELELGPQLIRIWRGRLEDDDLLQWFTTEKLLWNKSHGMSGIKGLDNHRQLAVYELLYLGISAKRNSFDRLINEAHKKFQRILMNETPRHFGARVTDEIFCFLFRLDIVRLRRTSMDLELPLEEIPDPQYESVVCDAEKALVNRLRPKYNEVMFDDYPQGSDGLFGGVWDRYLYSIREDITFFTDSCTFHGHSIFESNEGDFIFVTEDNFGMMRSGIDFPAHYGIQHEVIAERAYQLWLKKGCTHGDDWTDWFEAARQLVSERTKALSRM
jgi:hypothetical protein